MKSKLTLSVNKETVEKAKRYAKQHGVTLSSLVERYLYVLTVDEKPDINEISPNVMELAGILKYDEQYSSKEKIRELKRKYLLAKYNIDN